MTIDETIKTLKENLCSLCDYGSQSMESCDIRSCDNRDAIKALEQQSDGKTSKLDQEIARQAYILDCLMSLRKIYSTGDCNNCKNRDCGYIPYPGQLVRYNCPFYKEESDE